MSKSIKSSGTKKAHAALAGRASRSPRIKTKLPSAKNRSTRTLTAPLVRDDSKLGNIIALLRRKEGATIGQLANATSWQSHSVRGAIAGRLKKKLGLTITSAKSDGVRTYRIAV
jgi:hypothetical protein